MAEDKRAEGLHNVVMENRKSLFVSAVVDVVSFDDEKIVLRLNQSTMYISGGGLHITKLSTDSGEINISGSIDQITYSDKGGGKSRSTLSKIFR